jgi:Superfamily II DNA and RNA helicases
MAVYAGKTDPHDGLPLPPTIITYLGLNSPVSFCTSEIDFCISFMWAEAEGQMTITRSIVFTLLVPRGTKLKEHIIIGTPGKVVDWGVKFRFFDLGKISVFVLDEADVMIAMQGHQDQSFRIHK